MNNSGGGKNAEVPAEISGWSWPGFYWGWIWAIGNNVWIGLLALIPYVGLIMHVILGIYGKKWAWQSKHWESVEQFNLVQKKWMKWLWITTAVAFVLLIILFVFFMPTLMSIYNLS